MINHQANKDFYIRLIIHSSVIFPAGSGKPLISWALMATGKSNKDRIFSWTSESGVTGY